MEPTMNGAKWLHEWGQSLETSIFGWGHILSGRNLAIRKTKLLLSVAQKICYPFF
jgi:hypothetical protein